MSEVELLRKKIKRLKKAQEEAEFLLEKKSLDLYDLNYNLERQVEERTKEFENARDEAIAANEAKSQFLANMSHEIRTPLNGILGFIGLLEQSSLTNTQKEQLATISKSGYLLLNLINDILEFSKIEAGKLEIENSKFHLKRCVEDIVDVMANQVFDKKLEFPTYLDESIPKNFMGDESKIRQVLINLIGNAVKFTPTGEIAVEIHSKGIDPGGGHKLYFEVRDTGVGISKKKLGSIFSAFEQADVSDTRKYGGTGLGLTISQQIVSAMGGKLKVESDESIGSKFFFTITLGAPQDEETKYSTRSFDKQEEVSILISNKSVRKNLTRRLESWKAVCSSVEQIEQINWSSSSSSRKNLIIDHYFLTDPITLAQINGLLDQGIHVIVVAPPKEKVLLEKKLKDLKLDILVKPVKRESLFNSIEKKSKISDQQALENTSFVKTDISHAHLLLVEDNLVNQQLALAMLEVHGYTADIANNGKEAIEMFDSEKHDLIIMDCQMPVMDGLQATIEIRKNNTVVPIIAMTANAFKKTKEKCFEVGMDDFVTKPVSHDCLADVIQKVLQRKLAG